jgi:signal transduction histidine kinase
LVVNAVQAMPNGGVLSISLHQETPQVLGMPAVRLTVCDSGIGIDPTHRSRIFDPFFTTKEEGTGLGLAIVHSIVEAHQGRIDVESTLGQGTSCSIILPHPSIGGDPNEAPVRAQSESESGEAHPVEHEGVLAEEWSHE